jgi:plastocyanin
MSGLPRRVWTVAAVVAAAIGMAAPPAQAATTEVVASGMRFTPAKVQIELGDSVVWEAADDGAHTVTSRDGSFDSSPRGAMGEGDQYRFRFRVPGTFAYYCRVHQSRGMQGEIAVLDPSAPTTTTRLTPVTAAATTSSSTTATTAPTTTTSRPLATSSTTSRSIATATTAPTGTPLAPQEPPALNPNTRVVGSSSEDPGSDLPGARAAGATSDGTDAGPGTAVVVGLLAALGVAGGTVFFRARRRPSH